ncbi:AraC family transcriptional regulator [Marinobacterium mangrovicola]|uniref:AraC family transcriptional regulator n=1 Tax=Marinobacterium mangrovicola TaxID=1476959 RepID=A0A4R1GFV0_9GAMM|nr:AraC family transcriptional regulator [Marinobacterium mangrovicola]TCK03102.1 AraC family transcriptional regulator [Marinobacterium mangrovicola]
MQAQLEVRSYSAEVDRHSHRYHQLVLPVSGSLEIEIGSQGGEVAAHRAAVIHAGETHCFQSQGTNRFLVADLPMNCSDKLEPLPAFLSLSPDTLEYAALLGRMLQKPASADALQRVSCDLLLELLSRHTTDLNQSIDRRLLLAKTYLDETFASPIKLEQLCAIAHLSRRQLHTLFLRQLGCAPSEYLLRLRMNHARRLLIETELSIQRVSEQCGYQNLAAFSDRFRRHFGVAPSHYRRRLH